VIPGTFDPITVGHLDIIERAAKLFDTKDAPASENSAKQTMFNLDERREMLRLACLDVDNVIVDAANGLVVDYAGSRGAGFLIKGVRGAIDYEYEHSIFMINREIGSDIETIFFPAKNEHIYISSAFVREMIKYERDIRKYVPFKVAEFIHNRRNMMQSN
jgi:pantetheine-phosphate adenylyltransferase